MKKLDYLLTVLAEECSEVIKAASKSIRFGLGNHNPATPSTTNEYELVEEYYQLQAMMEMLQDDGFVSRLPAEKVEKIKAAKKAKVMSFLPRKHSATVCITQDLADRIEDFLNRPDAQEHDETVKVTVVFDDGREMDIKCCPSDDGPSWTEAVLFNAHGNELTCTEVSDEFLGPWEIEYGGDRYEVTVEVLQDQNYVVIPDGEDYVVLPGEPED